MKFRTKLLCVMKLTTALILFTCLSVSARVSSQTVSYTAKNARLEQVFSALEKQTGYGFFYKVGDLKDAKTVSIELKKVELKDALEKILKDQSLNYSIEGNTVFITLKKTGIGSQVTMLDPSLLFPPPPIDVHGVVKDETGKPVIGASVQVKGTNKGTTTNELGEFSLGGVDDKSVLVISSVNIETREVGINGRTEINLVAKVKISKLEDVEISNVNTGYQSIPKERSTGSFEKIDNKLFNEQTGTTVLARLEWIANGLYVDKKTNQSTPNITIRGLSTIRGPKAPLVILDNFPYDGDLNSINPNDVENITILKDAAAASIWGTRAGNGVIVITTKKAKYGQPLSIEFNNNVTISSKPDLFYYNDISPSDYIDLEQFLYGKGHYNTMINSTSKPVLSPVIEILIKKSNGSLSPTEADAKINAMRSQDVRNEFNRYMYQTAINQQYALNISGGTDRFTYRFAAGYDENAGNLNEQYRRLNFTTANTYKVSNNIQLTSGTTFTQINSISGNLSYNTQSFAVGGLPIYSLLADASGNSIPVMRQFRQPYLDTAGSGKLLNWNYYPLEEQKLINNSSSTNMLVANLGLAIKISRELSADIKYQYQRQSGSNDIVYDEESYYVRNLVNTYSQLNRSTGLVTYKVPTGGILSGINSLMQSHNIRGQLNYAYKWKNHELNILAGGELRQIRNSGRSILLYGYDKNVLTTGSVDFINAYPEYITGNTSFIPSASSPSETNNRFISFFGNAGYTYLNKYSLTVSGRRDASNLFGVATNDKWTPLWSSGFGWEINKEKFFNVKAVSFLKLRATYGISGNADPSRTAVTVLSYSGNSPYTLLPMVRINQFGNPDLRWEKVSMFNLGFDFRALGNRLGGSVEYYHKKGKDLFGNAPADYTTVATSSLIKNVASIEGSGWDVSLNSSNLTGAFSWITNLNFNINKDEVIDYYLPSRQATSFINGGVGITAVSGHAVFGVYSYKWAGLDPLTGDPMGYVNGKASKDYTLFSAASYPVDSLVYNGPAFPVIFGSMGNSFSYKGFSLTVRLSYKFGYYFLRPSVNYVNLFGNRQGHADYSTRWQNPGDEMITSVPSMVYPVVSRRETFYNNSEILVEKADHIRLQYITLDYDLKQAIRGLPFKSFNMYVNINNLGIIWRANKYGIDPDYRDRTIPPSKNIAIGIRANF